MVVIFHIEHGCLGPNGKAYIEDFCKHFTRHIRRALGDVGVQIFAAPRIQGDPEFRYLDPHEPHLLLTRTDVEKGLNASGLNMIEFEDGLSDLAEVFAASDEWQSQIKKTA